MIWNRKFWSRFFLVAAILTAGMIFFFSTQEGAASQSMSDGITLRVARVVKPDYEQLPTPDRLSFLSTLSTIVRKNAHFCEYALLGFNLMCHLRLRRWRGSARAAGLTAWGIAALYAASDEVHQRFVDMRSGQPLDVLIDASGALLGILVAVLALSLGVRGARRIRKGIRNEELGMRN